MFKLKHEATIREGSESMVLVVQTRYTTQRTVQDSVHSKTTANVDASIKSGILGSASLSFRLSDCKHTVDFSFPGRDTFYKSPNMI